MADPTKKRVQSTINQEVGRTTFIIGHLGTQHRDRKYDLYEDYLKTPLHAPEEEEEVLSETGDNCIGVEVSLPEGRTMHAGKVMKQVQDESGEFVGRKCNNLILDLQAYQVQFPYGEIAEYTANMIAENMISQCDPNSNQFLLMGAMTDHQKHHTTITDADRYVMVKGSQYPCKTTKGWQMCVTWRDRTTSWE